MLPCPLDEGALVAERVREAFEGSGIVCDEGAVDTTVSIGVAGGPAGIQLEVLLAAADTALYQAKRGSRNRVEAAEELPLSLENWRRKTAGYRRRRGRAGRRVGNLPFTIRSISSRHGLTPPTETQAALMALEAAAASARGGFACMFSPRMNTRRR